jgi:hypothetical protein
VRRVSLEGEIETVAAVAGGLEPPAGGCEAALLPQPDDTRAIAINSSLVAMRNIEPPSLRFLNLQALCLLPAFGQAREQALRRLSSLYLIVWPRVGLGQSHPHHIDIPSISQAIPMEKRLLKVGEEAFLPLKRGVNYA